MHAPGHPPTPPRRVPGRAWTVSMRVLFCALSVCSFGLLLWLPLLRLAIVRRRAADWWLTGAAFVLVCVLFLVIGRDGSDEPTGIDDILIPVLLLVMVAAPTYYLVADIRHHEQLRKQNLPGAYASPPAPESGYGYAPPAPMHGPGTAPTPAPAPVSAPVPAPAAPPVPPAPPHRSPRIDQVRAELDELSDYLRKEEGR
ncbi:hypothetical protein AB0L71_14285 [Streptomyces sp. NPDC052052]|uniref:hypothetical protein n=1 Tax=Streptomyces sp. NPDC052052 TaxID=3154756 RepID=UPI00342E6ABB